MVKVTSNLRCGCIENQRKRKREDKSKNRAKKFGKIFEPLRFSKNVTEITKLLAYIL
jgi:hypothetical protein